MKPGTYLKVVADTNDADYETEITLIDNETLEKYMPVIQAIKAFKPAGRHREHNWPKGEYGCREDMGEKTINEIYDHIDPALLEDFDDEYVPYGNEGNTHTIESIHLIEIVKVVRLV